ncbi:hypothetical protein PRZ48_010131 [Zasmidium cellare]|uniref:Uncharacterized protein n=1 Tax=Zasmidium cellare TaxID=395010 RepID=A0ABR0EEW8_ZASCE|nr:hypothetical protein PRZ48_010131 [Zasmidium cellare]
MAKQDEDEKTTIDDLVKKCKTGFDELQSQLGDANSQDAPAASDERARFNVWVDAVSREPFFGISKLDYQLRDSHSLRDRLKSLLKKLVKILQQARQPDNVKPMDLGFDFSFKQDADRSSFHFGNWDANTEQLMSGKWGFSKSRTPPQPDHRDEEVAVGGGPPASEAHDSVLSDQEVLDDLEAQNASKQTRQIERARRVVDMLLRLANTVRTPAPDDQIRSNALLATGSNHDLDVEQVKAQFPSISPYLAERLGKAIWKRRQYFLYKIRTAEKPSTSSEKADQAEAVSNINLTKEDNARTDIDQESVKSRDYAVIADYDSDESQPTARHEASKEHVLSKGKPVKQGNALSNINRGAAKRRQYAVYRDGAFEDKPSTKGNESGQEHDISDATSVGEDNAKTVINQEFAVPPLGAEIELDLPPVPEEGTASKCPLCGEVFNPTDSDFWV